ncbi:MAG: GNAT family N-acetyltransferase [Gemmatimonadales bacterium]
MTEIQTGGDTSDLHWTLDDATRIRPFQPDDAPALYRLISSSRNHLDRWLRWSNSIQSEADATATIARYVAKRSSGAGFHSGIWVQGHLAGGIVCRDLDPVSRNAEIGYWLGAGFTGRGLATRGTILMIQYLFGVRKLHRLEMQCAVDNEPSRAIPEKLGFRLEGIRRDSTWIATDFADHAVYGLLENEWNGPPELRPGRRSSVI